MGVEGGGQPGAEERPCSPDLESRQVPHLLPGCILVSHRAANPFIRKVGVMTRTLGTAAAEDVTHPVGSPSVTLATSCGLCSSSTTCFGTEASLVSHGFLPFPPPTYFKQNYLINQGLSATLLHLGFPRSIFFKTNAYTKLWQYFTLAAF